MNVLYLSNKEAPYRVEFFNQLSHKTDLTVVYDTRLPGDRNAEWAKSVSAAESLAKEYLPEGRIRQLRQLNRLIRKSSGFDIVVIGCVNTFTGLAAIALCRARRLRYIINLDGEIFISSDIKSHIKKIVLSGASGYVAAGRNPAKTVSALTEKDVPVVAYHFSSRTAEDVSNDHALRTAKGIPMTASPVLVVGQYFHYKGLDTAVAAARADRSVPFIFVGMGARTNQFVSDMGITEDGDPNITVIPFMQKKQLTDAYLGCSLMLLPSRKECWGLVVNEAASLGTPVVSTFGSGSAVDMIADKYPEMIVEPDNPEAMLAAIRRVRSMTESEIDAYSRFLMQQASVYTIDHSVDEHVDAFSAVLADANTQ